MPGSEVSVTSQSAAVLVDMKVSIPGLHGPAPSGLQIGNMAANSSKKHGTLRELLIFHMHNNLSFSTDLHLSFVFDSRCEPCVCACVMSCVCYHPAMTEDTLVDLSDVLNTDPHILATGSTGTNTLLTITHSSSPPLL